jgi:hypothetical protein
MVSECCGNEGVYQDAEIASNTNQHSLRFTSFTSVKMESMTQE